MMAASPPQCLTASLSPEAASHWKQACAALPASRRPHRVQQQRLSARIGISYGSHGIVTIVVVATTIASP